MWGMLRVVKRLRNQGAAITPIPRLPRPSKAPGLQKFQNGLILTRTKAVVYQAPRPRSGPIVLHRQHLAKHPHGTAEQPAPRQRRAWRMLLRGRYRSRRHPRGWQQPSLQWHGLVLPASAGSDGWWWWWRRRDGAYCGASVWSPLPPSSCSSCRPATWLSAPHLLPAASLGVGLGSGCCIVCSVS